MAPLWNPRRLLGVDPDGPFTCVGTTQKGSRCRNSFISNSDLANASSLLDQMATSDPWDARAHLSHLAEITLCPRWHRKPGYSQVESMKRKWWNIIVSTYPEPLPTRPITLTTSNAVSLPRNNRPASSSTESASASRSLPTPPPSPSPTPRQRPVAPLAPVVRRTTPVADPTPTVALQAPLDSPARSRASSNVSVLSTTRSTATAAALVTPPQSPRLAPARSRNDSSSTSLPATVPTVTASSSGTPPSPSRTPRRQPATTWLPLTPERSVQPSTPPCPHSSRRKPLNDECPICNEEIHCLDDAVWCRAQCGQNMHRGCFAPWRRACLDREVAVTCVYCRTPWKYEWEE